MKTVRPRVAAGLLFYSAIKVIFVIQTLTDMRKICIATGTRAEWGLLSPIAKALKNRDDVQLQIIATNMHLMPKYGETWKQIVADGFDIDFKVPMPEDTDTPGNTARAMSIALAGFADAFEALHPDMLVILGDRYEMLAVASAALIFRIPIVHIAGGEISEGAYDDSIRHAITKMSHLHLTETEDYRRRVIQLGENPDTVFNTGAIGVHNILNLPLLSHEEIEAETGVKINENTVLVTFHPATLDSKSPEVQCRNMLAALESHRECNFIFTYPNNDTNGAVIIRLIEEFKAKNPDRVAIFRSLGQIRYFSVLKYAGAVVGNSSSGIIEVPSIGIPTLNIGIRQQGRIAAASVFHCGVSESEIKAGLDKILSPEVRELARKKKNPYFTPNTLEKMVDIICNTSFEKIKHFYNIKFNG